MRRTPLLGLLLSALLCFPVRATSAQDGGRPLHPDDPQFREIVSAMRHWEGFWKSLRVTYRTRTVSAEGLSEYEATHRYEASVEWVLSDLPAEKSHFVQFLDGQVRSRMAAINAPDRCLSLTYPSGESRYEEPSAVAIGRAPVLMVGLFGAGPLNGLRTADGKWFSQRIKHCDIELLERKRLRGCRVRDCW